jgi:hypothetical protein
MRRLKWDYAIGYLCHVWDLRRWTTGSERVDGDYWNDWTAGFGTGGRSSSEYAVCFFLEYLGQILIQTMPI